VQTLCLALCCWFLPQIPIPPSVFIAQKLTCKIVFLLVSVQTFKLGIKMQASDKREWLFGNQLVSDWIIARFDLACTNYSQTYSAPYFLFNCLPAFGNTVVWVFKTILQEKKKRTILIHALFFQKTIDKSFSTHVLLKKKLNPHHDITIKET
jgi:hypothetical protein